MVVLKFGGGVLKTSENIIQATEILKSYNEAVVVVSAFGKMTNTFEQLVLAFFEKRDTEQHLINIKDFHYALVNEIFDKNDSLFQILESIFAELNAYLQKQPSTDYDFEYDQIIPFGEILSSTICFSFFNKNDIKSKLIDVRKCIKTNSVHRDASVNWETSKYKIKESFSFGQNKICVTQGFIASNDKGEMTTLGREGSDFTAAILAFCLDASSVEFWKEVNGIYNCDPQKNEDFVLLPKLSYREAVEQVYFGAKILHPKTIKPLQNKKIPVLVRSFTKPEASGTIIEDISKFRPDYYPATPIYIEKENQVLISFSARDFSFVDENNLGKIFSALAEFRIKSHLMQNSALKFSICVDNDEDRLAFFLKKMKTYFEVLSNKNLVLVTIRHFTPESIAKKTKNRKIYISQKSRRTARFVLSCDDQE